MRIVISDWGVVSPAGWGKDAFRKALAEGAPLAPKEVPRPGQSSPLRVRSVPPLAKRPDFITHARLRRTSPISQYVVAAALEALGPDVPLVQQNQLTLGIVLCVTCGCVNYSRRFYDEAWKNPSTASPLLFPETVFNAPSSHLAALLGTTAITYTLVGEPTNFLVGLAIAGQWIRDGRVQSCLVVGAEENDWLTADAARLLDPDVTLSDGAGALYLKKASEASPQTHTELISVTDPQFFANRQARLRAAQTIRDQLTRDTPSGVLSDGMQGAPKSDFALETAWRGWAGHRLSPKRVLGEGLSAAAAWQCACALDALADGSASSALVSVMGMNQQVIGACFRRI